MPGPKLGAENQETKSLSASCSPSSGRNSRKDPNIGVDCGKDSHKRVDG